MEIRTKHGKVFLDTKNIIAVSVDIQERYNSDEKDYNLEFGLIGNGFIPRLQFDNLSLAQGAVESIMSEIAKREENEDDYIKGFKDGVEYALKLKPTVNV